MHEVAVDQPTTCNISCGFSCVEIDKCVDSVNPQSNEKEEGFATVHINGNPIEMKVDTGVKCNVMSQQTFKQVTNGKQLVKQEKAENLVVYGGSRIKTKGLVTLLCCLRGQHHPFPLLVVDREVLPLLGFCACMSMGIVTVSRDVHQVTMESNTDFTT